MNLSITNILGEKIKQYSISPIMGTNKYDINLNDISNGIYFLNFNNNTLNIHRKNYYL